MATLAVKSVGVRMATTYLVTTTPICLLSTQVSLPILATEKVLDFSNIVVGNWDDALGRGWQGHTLKSLFTDLLTNEEVNAIGHGLAGKYAIAEIHTDPLGDVDTTTAGDYTITYTASDEGQGNTTTGTRTIRVADDASQPILVLNGSAQDTIEVGTDHTDPGATATAGIGGEVLNAKVLSEGTIDKTLLALRRSMPLLMQMAMKRNL